MKVKIIFLITYIYLLFPFNVYNLSNDDFKIVERKINLVIKIDQNLNELPKEIIKSNNILFKNINDVTINKNKDIELIIILDDNNIIKGFEIDFENSNNFQFELINGINKNSTKNDIIKVYGKEYDNIHNYMNLMVYNYEIINNEIVKPKFNPNRKKLEVIILSFILDNNKNIKSVKVGKSKFILDK